MTLLQYLSLTVYRHYLQKLRLPFVIRTQSAIFLDVDFRNPKTLTNANFRNPKTLTNEDFVTITEIT